ncbi:hypothetical protein FN846DRAFT_983512 [Sphaerosporella brunnea]|uniref:Uncharacterized protein n=1 Tax=Sphaerosporella brunnea TaxID=1250544 RepID=A0A5J5FBV3_9PEZI|nr:hypothetical protein FN846DRAFT_983512 [Sphaerosporella brunnea]
MATPDADCVTPCRQPTRRMDVSPPIQGFDWTYSSQQEQTTQSESPSQSNSGGSPVSESSPFRRPSDHYAIREADGLERSPTAIWIPHLTPVLHSAVPQDENTPSSEQSEVSPRPLQDPLQQGPSRNIEIAGQRLSYASDVSSLSPSEADMMTGGPIVYPRTGRSFERHHPGLLGLPMDTVMPTREEIMEMEVDHRRFSNVPSVFDVASPIPATRARTNTDSTVRPSNPRPQSITNPEPSEAHSPSTVPMFSLVAGAAVGPDIISGNRTLEQSSFGSEETAPRKRHYEGCMLCSPQPSPESSIRSEAPEPNSISRGDPGPPPDVELPPLIHPSALEAMQGPISTPTEPNALKQYLQLEGEVGTPDLGKSEAIPPGDLGEVDYFSQQHGPFPTTYQRRGSLSTLMEGDEESNIQSRQPSSRGARMQSSERPRTDNTTTSQTRSEDSLVPGSSPSRPSDARHGPFGGSRRLLQRKANPLAAIQETSGALVRRLTDRLTRNSTAVEIQSIELNDFIPPNVESHEDPHPGVRVDRPGVDGTFEVVNLDATPAVPITPARRVGRRTYCIAISKWPRKLHLRRRYAWPVGIAIFIISVVIILIPVFFIAIPNIAQKGLSASTFNVTSLKLMGATADSAVFNLTLATFSQFPEVELEPDTLLELRQTKPLGKRLYSPPNTNTGNGLLGSLRVREGATKLAEGVVVTGTSKGDRLKLADPLAFGGILSRMVFSVSGVEVELWGTAEVVTAGVSQKGLEFKKAIELPGVGGFETRVSSYDINENFTTQFELTSEASVELHFGTVHFDLLYGLTSIGTVTVEAFKIAPGKTEIIAHGYMNTDMKANPEILGRFLTALYIQNGNPTTALALKGRTAMDGETEIGWLTAAVQKLEVPLPAVDARLQEDIFSDLELNVTIGINNKSTIINGFIAGVYNFTLGTGESNNTVVKKAGHLLDLSTTGGSTFARLNTSLSSISTQAGKAVSEIKNVDMQVLDRTAISKEFFKRLLQEDAFNVSISDKFAAEVDTSLGVAKFEDIKIAKTSLLLNGYGGFSSAKLDSPQIIQSLQTAGFQLNVMFKLDGMSSIGLKLGQVSFRVYYSTLADPVGTLDIADFNLESTKGKISVPATLTLGKEQAAKDAFNGFLASYFAGGAIPLRIDAPNASKNTIIADSMYGLNFSAAINSPGYSGFLLRVGIRVNNDGIGVDIEFVNLLPVSMAVQGFELQIKDAETGVTVGKASTPKSSGFLAKDQVVVFKVSLQEALSAKSLKELFSGDRPCEIDGVVNVGFGSGTASVMVGVRRIVGVSEDA